MTQSNLQLSSLRLSVSLSLSLSPLFPASLSPSLALSLSVHVYLCVFSWYVNIHVKKINNIDVCVVMFVFFKWEISVCFACSVHVYLWVSTYLRPPISPSLPPPPLPLPVAGSAGQVITGNHETYLISADSAESADSWVAAIRRVMHEVSSHSSTY